MFPHIVKAAFVFDGEGGEGLDWKLGTGPSVTVVDPAMAHEVSPATLRNGIYAGDEGLLASSARARRMT